MNNIILIGFMGSGKTTLGNFIADRSDMDFIDTDVLIEEQQGRSIKEIFASEGEEFFRDLETETLRNLKGRQNTIISVGGGLPIREINRQLMSDVGIVIYLRATKETLVKRLGTDKKRPLLAGGKLEERIDSLMAERKDIYMAAADFVVDTDDRNFESIYSQIKKKF